MNLGSRSYIGRTDLDAICLDRLAGTRLAGLFVAGSLAGLRAPTVAIVGTRSPSDAGRLRARQLASELATAGVCVVSGLALGIDSAAHEGSLIAGAPTIGVLGGGHERFFPARNRELAARIIAGGGAVVSPFAPHEPARPYQFLARNGVVAALADAVVVVEAAARSGALNTASWAADRALPVMAFPGDVDRPKVAGCLALIRDGAVLVRDATDVLTEIGISPPRRQLKPSHPKRDPGTPLGRQIVARLAAEPASIESLLGTQSPIEVLTCVGELLSSGFITESDALLRVVT